jgi:transcriptional regulator with XRE-family HTH domain
MLKKYIPVSKEKGQKIKKIRIKLGLTQIQLAKKAGIKVSTLIRAEEGRTRLCIKTLHAISGALNIYTIEILL